MLDSFSHTLLVNLVDCVKIPCYEQDSIAYSLFEQLIFFNFLTHIGQQKNNFKKNFEMKPRIFESGS